MSKRKTHFMYRLDGGFEFECGRQDTYLNYTTIPSETTCLQCKAGIAHLSDESRAAAVRRSLDLPPLTEPRIVAKPHWLWMGA